MSYNLLKGKRGIITGALDENSIAWKVAEKAHEEGATFVLTNAPIAMRMGEIKKLAEKTNSQIIPADATSVEELTTLFTQSQEILGGKIDFVLHSIGMSVNIRKNIPYTESNYDYFMKGIDVSAMSFHKMLAVAKKLDAISDWGSVVALTYMAAQRTYPFYTDMADIKAMLESIARSFGYHYGLEKKVRINTVSQSPTKTTAGTGIKGFGDFYDYANAIAPLAQHLSRRCAWCQCPNRPRRYHGLRLLRHRTRYGQRPGRRCLHANHYGWFRTPEDFLGLPRPDHLPGDRCHPACA
ncbi:MAG: enoyl-ACP reductase FabI, partial [Bacteroidia bacterium]